MRLPLVACLLGFSTLAHAQPGAEPPAEPPPVPAEPPLVPAEPPAPAPIVVAPPVVTPPPEVPASTVDKGVVEDANSGRSWLSPTALTPPAGTWSFSDFELFVISGSYAISDQVSVSATTLLPIVKDQPFFGIGSVKAQIIKSGNVRAALQLAIIHASDGDVSTNAAIAGGAVTLCIDSDCRSHFTGYLGAGFANQDQSSVPFVASAAATLRLNKRVKAVFEADTGFVVGDFSGTSDAFLAWYGLRFTSREIGVDLGFAKPICNNNCDVGLAMGAPFVSFTYRAFKND